MRHNRVMSDAIRDVLDTVAGSNFNTAQWQFSFSADERWNVASASGLRIFQSERSTLGSTYF